MQTFKLTLLVFLVIATAGCTKLTKTGKFVWNAPGKVVSGIAKTGKVVWNIAPKSPSQLQERAKFIWGSSTKALEDARVNAINKTYQCSYDDCYDAVLSLARVEPVYIKKYNEEGQEVDDEGNVKEVDLSGSFDVFINNRLKKHIVVMGVSGNVETTEVGIFFTQPKLTTIKLEVSSKSSSAKRKVAEAIFSELDLRFSAVE